MQPLGLLPAIASAVAGVLVVRALQWANEFKDRYARLSPKNKRKHKQVNALWVSIIFDPFEVIVLVGMLLAAVLMISICISEGMLLTISTAMYIGATAPSLLGKLVMIAIPVPSVEQTPPPPTTPRRTTPVVATAEATQVNDPPLDPVPGTDPDGDQARLHEPK